MTKEKCTINTGLLRAYKTIDHNSTSIQDMVDFTGEIPPEFQDVPEEYWPYISASFVGRGIIPGRVDVREQFVSSRNELWNRLMYDICIINQRDGVNGSDRAIAFVRRSLLSFSPIDGDSFDTDAIDRLGLAVLESCVDVLDILSATETDVLYRIVNSDEFLEDWGRYTESIYSMTNIVNSIYCDLFASEIEQKHHCYNPEVRFVSFLRSQMNPDVLSKSEIIEEICNPLISDLKVQTRIAIDTLL